MNKERYVYDIYGMKVSSEIKMPELKVANVEYIKNGKYDVTIIIDEIKNLKADYLYENRYYKIKQDSFYLHIDKIANYLVQGGEEIIVEPFKEANIEDVKVYLLGTCFGMLLKQKNVVSMHGGAISIDGKGIIVTGQSGAGKSSLTNAFREKKYTFFSDDVVALQLNNQKFVEIQPTYPQQKLCLDAFEKFGYNTEGYVQIDSDRKKYAIPLGENFAIEPGMLNGIYELNVWDKEYVAIEEITGIEKVKAFFRNIYRIELINLIKLEPMYFKQCINIVNLIKIYKIYRPINKFTVNEQVESIISTL